MSLSKIVVVRLAEDEITNLENAAAALNLNHSEYIRLACSLQIVQSSEQDSVAAIDAATLIKLFRELNRWGVNFNQGIKAINYIAARLKSTNLSTQEQSAVAAQSVSSLKCLQETADAINSIEAILEALSARLAIALPKRTITKLRGVD